MTALWFWDVGGMVAEPLRRGANKVTCYTCGAIFAWPAYAQPQCPVCKSRGTCDSGPSIAGAFDISIRADYVRDDDAPVSSCSRA